MLEARLEWIPKDLRTEVGEAASKLAILAEDQGAGVSLLVGNPQSPSSEIVTQTLSSESDGILGDKGSLTVITEFDKTQGAPSTVREGKPLGRIIEIDDGKTKQILHVTYKPDGTVKNATAHPPITMTDDLDPFRAVARRGMGHTVGIPGVQSPPASPKP